jgi:hypothetical protein
MQVFNNCKEKLGFLPTWLRAILMVIGILLAGASAIFFPGFLLYGYGLLWRVYAFKESFGSMTTGSEIAATIIIGGFMFFCTFVAISLLFYIICGFIHVFSK